MSLYNLSLLASGLFLLNGFIAWLFFARLSMARIEKTMVAEGIEKPAWDSAGFRVPSYAWAIMLPMGRGNPANSPIVNVPVIKRLATRRDWYLATWLNISSLGFLLFGFIVWALIKE